MSEDLTQDEVKKIMDDLAKAEAKSKSKYRNIKERVDGITFDSKREADRYRKLALRQRLGDIKNLQTQVPFELVVGDVLVCKYIADFTYEEVDTGKFVVADAKGFRTKEYAIKKKLMRAIHKVEILEL